MMWKEKLEALCKGLEIENIPLLLSTGSIEDFRKLGEVMTSRIKDRITTTQKNGHNAQQPNTAICRIFNKKCDHYGGDGKCELPATGECHEKQQY